MLRLFWRRRDGFVVRADIVWRMRLSFFVLAVVVPVFFAFTCVVSVFGLSVNMGVASLVAAVLWVAVVALTILAGPARLTWFVRNVSLQSSVMGLACCGLAWSDLASLRAMWIVSAVLWFVSAASGVAMIVRSCRLESEIDRICEASAGRSSGEEMGR